MLHFEAFLGKQLVTNHLEGSPCKKFYKVHWKTSHKRKRTEIITKGFPFLADPYCDSNITHLIVDPKEVTFFT